ncbi:beta-N-acetylhexosaminidase [Pseudoruegeria sp. SHC-113]|nr:beta-N-acetylhexosaminidase [Pseudoruegeria sp. SHC-113]MCT8160736.1 beta-N-acetylhexosaminidase [Pseudoruegeria sp. SHC-113]
MSAQGAVIFGCEGLAVTPEEQAFFAEAQPWGFILFARNVESPAQLVRLTSDLRAAVGRDVPVFIDQEGGRVQRMRAPHWREWLPPLEEVARAGTSADRALFLRYRLIAAELRAVGIDGNCSPCADVATPHTHPVLRNRCLSSDAGEVARLARVVAEAHLAGGVLPVLKHIPGHGRASLDSHKELPRVSALKRELQAVDFAPFKALSDLPLGMSAHIVFEDIAPDGPATTSPTMVRLIREEIGFDGLLMTDDLSMEALSGSVSERARASLAAGCDMILHCNGKLPEMEAIAAEAGALGGAALARAKAAMAARRAPEPADLEALLAEHEALLRVPAP